MSRHARWGISALVLALIAGACNRDEVTGVPGTAFRSPDGTRIAFSRTGQLTVINSDGTRLTSVSTPEGGESPSWSPDGTRIAYTSFINTRDVFISSADGSNPVRVTTASEQENNPRWLPDSRQLVFCRVVDGFFQLFTINADGTGEAKLSANPITHECPPSWSPVP